MALVGIQTGRGPTEFVAKRGGAAIPYLDEAWARDSLDRGAVVRTWGYMVGPFASKLARGDSLAVMARLLRAAREQPQSFTWAADIAGLAEAVPLLDRIAQSKTHEIIRRHAAAVSLRLSALRDSLPATELARRFEVWVSAACEPTGIAARSRCETLTSLAREVRDRVRTMGVRGARGTLDSLVHEGRRAFAGGALSEVEDALIAGNAEYLKTRP
jgi:hypothetical protein